MNEKEIAEIRRRYKTDKNNITGIRGCYVNEKNEIVAEFHQSLALMPEEEAEQFLSVLKKTLSGTLGRNLMDIAFSNEQVVDSEEHRLLMKLRNSELKDEEAIQSLFHKVIENTRIEGNYLILMGFDTYDIPFRSKDGERQFDASSEMYSYILCSVCPIKEPKPALSYFASENVFHNRRPDLIVSPPEMGFLFPAFDDRSSNIYNALYYTKNISDGHEDFVNALFGREVPMSAAVQKETFQEILGTALQEECSFETVQAVHAQLQEMIEEHKVNKEEEPLTVSKGMVKKMLETYGVSDERVQAFEEQYDKQFGAETAICPKNIVNAKQTEIITGDVKIQIAAGRDDLVDMKLIEGRRYILIRAEGDVEFGGVPVKIQMPEGENADTQ